ncbi:hemicentin-1-like [Antennarius striatus]|uniref:hemicentin-1-like n=1 Tax=Antennarius striatus TaxID=241820 RepID=UPI0035AE288B
MALMTLLCVLLVSFTALTEGAGLLPETQLNGVVGGARMFTTTLIPGTPYFALSWKFGDEAIFDFNVKNTTGAEYEGRITVFMSTGSLELRNLTHNDSGVYQLIIVPQGSPIIQGNTRLIVYELVSNVVVRASNTDLVEFNSTVRLSCSCSGSSPSFLWMNSSSEVTASDRVQLTDGGSTLTIVNVSRYDQGPFWCQVSNPVSNGSSGPVNLSVSFGPENIILTSSNQEYNKKGSNVTLSCSAVSKPSAQLSWFLNGDKLRNAGPELRLVNVQLNQSGNYTCQAFNQKTGWYGDSLPSPLTVLEMISYGSITSSTNVSIEGNSVNFTCEATGSIFTRRWTKDGSELVLTDDTVFHDGNRVLSFNRISRGDSGEYFCNISNPLSSDWANYILVVNYGPDNVKITGPNELHFGDTLVLTCSAESTPPASFTWKRNGTVIHNSAVFTINISDISDNDFYTCQAMNNITGRITTVEHELIVTDRSSGCSSGCIAGICIACIVVICSVAAGLLICQRNREKQKQSRTLFKTEDDGGKGEDNTAYSSQEPNYVDIDFGQNKDRLPNQLDPQTNSSEYAEIRVMNDPPPAASPPTYDVYLQRKSGIAPQPDANGTELYARVLKDWALASGAVEVKPSVNPAVVGDTVMLSLSPSGTVSSGSWSVGGSLIITWARGEQLVFPSHDGRASVDVLTGALNVSSLTVADSGVYIVQSSNPQIKANASISVLEPITNVTVSVNQTNLMEISSSAVVTCSVSSGSSMSFVWMNSSSEVTASDRVQLTDGGSTLTIVNVSRHDQGPFRCHVFNSVSNGTSRPLNLSISYGPDGMTITVNGQNTTFFSSGSNLSMFCSAQSNPRAHLQWAVRGELMNTTGPLLELVSVSEDQSGTYSCLAFNNHTKVTRNVTANITIADVSGSEQQAVNIWLLPLLLLVGFFL